MREDMRTHHAELPLLTLLLVVPSCAKTTLQLASGTIRGSTSLITGERSFLGVPFAQPPVGSLRWQPPLQEHAWEGERDARGYSASCMQSSNAFTALTKISEDCLYLNLWLPNQKKHPPPPNGYAVMLFFYGGSWTTGSAMFPLYTGKHLAKHGVIAIASNYRLNVFGFLGGELLRGADNSTGNFGILDQRLAMRWVQRNAAALSADPSRVMIFGESAGAGSVSNHLVREASWGLFTRAAMESGPLADWTAVSMVHAEVTFKYVVSAANCTGQSSEAAKLQACLRGVSANDLATIAKHAPKMHPVDFVDWIPVIDGVELTKQPQDLANQGHIAPEVPILLGTNANEGTMFVHIPLDANMSTYKAYLADEPIFAGQVERVSAVYNGTAQPPQSKPHASSEWWAASAVIGDMLMDCAARRSARWLSARPGNSSSTFLYHFEHKLAFIDAVEITSGTPYGVFHGSEVPFVFHIDEILVEKSERDLAARMGSFWTQFAMTGRPTDEATWPAFTTANDLSLRLRAGSSAVLPGLKHDLCDFWDAFEPSVPP